MTTNTDTIRYGSDGNGIFVAIFMGDKGGRGRGRSGWRVFLDEQAFLNAFPFAIHGDREAHARVRRWFAGTITAGGEDSTSALGGQ